MKKIITVRVGDVQEQGHERFVDVYFYVDSDFDTTKLDDLFVKGCELKGYDPDEALELDYLGDQFEPRIDFEPDEGMYHRPEKFAEQYLYLASLAEPFNFELIKGEVANERYVGYALFDR